MTVYHVLLPVDANEDRVQGQVNHVTMLPNAHDSVRVTLLYVSPTVDGDAGTERVGDHMGRPETIEIARQQLGDHGVEVESREEEGEVARTILTVAENLNPDVIVVAGRKRTPVGKAIFGSVSQQVILNANCAVTVVK